MSITDYRNREITEKDLTMNNKGGLCLKGPGVVRGKQVKEIGSMIRKNPNLFGPNGIVKVNLSFSGTGITTTKNGHLIPDEYKKSAKQTIPKKSVKKNISKISEINKDITKLSKSKPNTNVDINSLLKKLNKDEGNK